MAIYASRRVGIKYISCQSTIASLPRIDLVAQMALLLQLHRVFAAIVLLVVLGTEAKTCKNPSVRREWRALSTSERIEWITAVKVSTVF
jgi:hypothetical protein